MKKATHLLPTLLAVREALAQGNTDLEPFGARISQDHSLIQVKVKDEWASFHAKDLETIIRGMEETVHREGKG